MAFNLLQGEETSCEGAVMTNPDPDARPPFRKHPYYYPILKGVVLVCAALFAARFLDISDSHDPRAALLFDTTPKRPCSRAGAMPRCFAPPRGAPGHEQTKDAVAQAARCTRMTRERLYLFGTTWRSVRARAPCLQVLPAARCAEHEQTRDVAQAARCTRMTKERLYLFDTTLRDGAQTTGVDFSLEDKRLIIKMLDELGLDYVEGGYPGANVTDTELFATEHTLNNATLTAFGMTKRAGRSVSNDPGLQAILQARCGAICLVAKAWDYHVDLALGTTIEEHIQGLADSVAAVVKSGREAIIDCEHFFDGWKANRNYALNVARCAHDAGARWAVLCDTNGGTLPHEVGEIVADVARQVPGSHLGIHTHNDTENAVANTLAAVRAGARQIQGTLNGLGERCGNANLTSSSRRCC